MSNSNRGKFFGRRWVVVTLSFLFFLALAASRKWGQFETLLVWTEDGVQIIPSLINNGWKSFIEAPNGYLVTVPRIISAISLWISITMYPLTSTLLSWLFAALVGLAVAFAPTKNKGKFLCALAIFLVPCDPEVFLLPLYTYWWASILLFLVVLWDEENPAPIWRISFLLLGGLSSPVIFILSPILCLRAYIYRAKRLEIVIALLAIIITVIQFSFSVSSVSSTSIDTILLYTIPTFFGNFLAGSFSSSNYYKMMIGALLVLVFLVWAWNNKNRFSTWGLSYLLGTLIVITGSRVPLFILHPKLAGPRYFFLPYVLIAWILIDCFCSATSVRMRVVAGLLIILTVINSFPVWFRDHTDLHWKDHIITSKFFDRYDVPLTTDGSQNNLWFMPITGEKSSLCLSKDRFLTEEQILNAPTYPYSICRYERSTTLDSPVRVSSVIKSTMTGRDYFESALPGYKVIGSYNASAPGARGKGSVWLSLRREDKLLYRSGSKGGNIVVEGYEKEFIPVLPHASPYWVILDFSNSKLPDKFILRVEDNAEGEDVWCAVALKIHEETQ